MLIDTMLLTTKIDCLDFTPDLAGERPNAGDIGVIVERAIIEGSGGPDNVPITTAGLRFVRFLLSILPDGPLPNFQSSHAIKALSRLFIYRCGNPVSAIDNIQAIMHGCNHALMAGNDIAQS